MSKEKDFKPQFLYCRESKYNALLSEYKSGVFELNNLLQETEKLLDRGLTDQEIALLSKNKVSFVLKEVRSKFQFPAADESFNLEALGINIRPFKEASERTTLAPSYNYVFKDGKFHECEKYKKEIKEQFYIYTENERQNKALQLSKELLSIVSELEKMGLSYGLIPTLLGRPLIGMERLKRVPEYDTIKSL